MKNKLLEEDKKIEREEREEDIDLANEGPGISSAKKSKMTIIFASTLLISIVIYFFFFRADNKSKKEDLEEVNLPKTSNVSRSGGGKSPFEFDEIPVIDDKKDVVLEKPLVPEIPSLPALPTEDNKGLLPVLIGEQETPKPVIPEEKKEAVKEEKNAELKQDQNNVAEDKADKSLDPRYSPIIVLSGEAGPARSVGYEKNIVKLNEDPILKLTQTQSQIIPTYVKDRTHTIAQGKMLTAVLETAINTEIPGSVRGVISRDVYGESGNEVLIPRGSRLFGSYTSQVTRGQGRVEITWTRLIRPDGVDLNVSFNAADQFGRSGISGDVDNRYSSVLANSILTSILAVGGVAAAESLIGGNSSSTTTTNSDGSVSTTGKASSQAIYDVSKTIIDTVGQVTGAALNLGPVIRVPQGTRITVIVNNDMTVPAVRKAYGQK